MSKKEKQKRKKNRDKIEDIKKQEENMDRAQEIMIENILEMERKKAEKKSKRK